MGNIILASASHRRIELLNQIGAKFKVQPSNIDESAVSIKGSPTEKAEKLSLMKAIDVAGNNDKSLIIGADTIVLIDGEILGKPKNQEDAFRMLSMLGGRAHFVITGVAVLDSSSGAYRVGHEITKVFFSNLEPEKIRAYIDTGEPEGKAGAYAIQGIGALLVEKIEGCYFNVVGLPLFKVSSMLEEFGKKLL